MDQESLPHSTTSNPVNLQNNTLSNGKRSSSTRFYYYNKIPPSTLPNKRVKTILYTPPIETIEEIDYKTFYKCTFEGCKQTFPKHYAMVYHAHVQRHLPDSEKPFQCTFPDCKRAFVKKSELEYHLRGHNGIKPFKCEQCGKAYSRVYRLTQHIKRHVIKEKKMNPTDEESSAAEDDTANIAEEEDDNADSSDASKTKSKKTFKCSVDGCGASFNQFARLSKHHRTHPSDKPVKCDKCDRTFIRKHFLKKHLRTHGIMHKCNHCDEEFSELDFIQHQISHTNADAEKNPSNIDINSETSSSSAINSKATDLDVSESEPDQEGEYSPEPTPINEAIHSESTNTAICSRKALNAKKEDDSSVDSENFETEEGKQITIDEILRSIKQEADAKEVKIEPEPTTDENHEPMPLIVIKKEDDETGLGSLDTAEVKEEDQIDSVNVESKDVKEITIDEILKSIKADEPTDANEAKEVKIEPELSTDDNHGPMPLIVIKKDDNETRIKDEDQSSVDSENFETKIDKQITIEEILKSIKQEADANELKEGKLKPQRSSYSKNDNFEDQGNGKQDKVVAGSAHSNDIESNDTLWSSLLRSMLEKKSKHCYNQPTDSSVITIKEEVHSESE